MLKYMLDTNIVIYVIKRRPIEVLATFNKHVSNSQFEILIKTIR
jgi:tRNA(fMet)-specific endonuclease VapC